MTPTMTTERPANARPTPATMSYDEFVGDRSAQWTMQDIADNLGVKYATVVSYRRKNADEGGEGPSALPEPDGKLGATPWWYPGTVRRWALQRGQLNQETWQPQTPKNPGQGKQASAA